MKKRATSDAFIAGFAQIQLIKEFDHAYKKTEKLPFCLHLLSTLKATMFLKKSIASGMMGSARSQRDQEYVSEQLRWINGEVCTVEGQVALLAPGLEECATVDGEVANADDE